MAAKPEQPLTDTPVEPPAFHWGILGPGKIARKFAEDLRHVPGATLTCVASRSAERAAAFAADFGAEYNVAGYEHIFDGPALDAVYIAVPHTGHRELTEMCLERGIPVLCEKPLGLNYGEVRAMVATARRTGTYLLEALWTRFLPSTAAVIQQLAAGSIGRLESLRADFGFRAPTNPDSRLLDPALGGGALLDIGIYPVFLAQLLVRCPRLSSRHRPPLRARA